MEEEGLRWARFCPPGTPARQPGPTGHPSHRGVRYNGYPTDSYLDSSSRRQRHTWIRDLDLHSSLALIGLACGSNGLFVLLFELCRVRPAEDRHGSGQTALHHGWCRPTRSRMRAPRPAPPAPRSAPASRIRHCAVYVGCDADIASSSGCGPPYGPGPPLPGSAPGPVAPARRTGCRKVPDEAKLTYRIKQALIALYRAFSI